VANPCGLYPKAFFNDTYTMKDEQSNEVFLKNTGISWETDREYRFKKGSDSEVLQWHDPTDEHFINWMRPATFTKFLKLWAIVDDGLESGTYTITVKNNYDVQSFDGKKYVYVSTTNALGGKNAFLGIVYIIFGVVCILALIVFYVKGKSYQPKQYTELSF